MRGGCFPGFPPYRNLRSRPPYGADLGFAIPKMTAKPKSAPTPRVKALPESPALRTRIA
jgi:hypothetical protein